MKRHILIVDDDLMISKALRTYLERKGFRVTLAENCGEGRAILSSKTPVDLMILDYFLPDGRGTDLLEAMGGDSPLQTPPVIVSSSWVDPKSPFWEALTDRLPTETKSLIQACVQKPYTFSNMDDVLQVVFHSGPQTNPPNTTISGDF